MNNRRDIIKYWAKKINAQSYLELGVRDFNSVFNHIPCVIKHSVDINMESANYTMSTDEFFFKLKNSELDIDKNYKWDVIFIDANHLCDFVKKDSLNALEHLNDNGIIFLHDVLPTKYENQTEYGGNQTAWKIIPYLLKNHPEIHVCTIPENDGGLGIIIKNHLKIRETLPQDFNIFYEYYIMDIDRVSSQNEIKYNDLESWIDNPSYHFGTQNENYKTNIYKDHFKK
jgi:hypothetical protein